MKEFEIKTDPAKCAGCLNCRLICSFTHEKVFNPSKARIIIDYVEDGFEISFTEECSRCGTCAQYCLYGALEAIKNEKGAA